MVKGFFLWKAKVDKSDIATNNDDTALFVRDFGLRNTSEFLPPQNNHVVEAFVELVERFDNFKTKC